MATLSLAAVSGLGRKSNVAFSANHLLTLVLSGEGDESGFNLDRSETTTTETQDKMESGLFLNVIVLESSSVLELLAGKNKTLLVWGNTFLVLNFSLDVFDSVTLLDIERDRLSGQGLDENLHFIYLLINPM